MRSGAAVRGYEVLVGGATLAVVITTIVSIRPGQWLYGTIIVIALIIGAAPFVIDATVRGRRPWAEPLGAPAEFTTVIRLGAELAEVARTSIILAARAGPTVVITTRRRDLLDTLGPIDVSVYVAPSYELALRAAANSIETTAVMIVSASAFPSAATGRRAAGWLHGDAGWTTGRTEAPNRDRYAPREREMLAERVRADARAAGAVLWEPDATLVRTDLIRAYPIAPGRPWGSWLRDLEARGYHGIETATPISSRAAPADAPEFWPTQLMRTRATAADLAGATGSGPVRSRLLAGAALTRELYGWSLALWALIPLVIGWSGTFPLSYPPLTFVAALGVTATGRWSATRLTHGVGLHPVHDLRAAAYDAPGSLLALPSALTRRIRPRRIRIPEQPLLWFALAFTLATTVLLLNRATASDSGANIAAGAAVLNIVLLWIVAIRAIGKRGWDRTVYRLPVDLPVLIDGTAARMAEASPVGCAVVGRLAAVAPGAVVKLVVSSADLSSLELDAVVASRRTAGPAGEVLGLSLRLEPAVRSAWIGALFDAAARVPNGPPAHRFGRSSSEAKPERPPFLRSFVFRIQMVLVGIVSLVAVSILALVLLGLRPLVISSGSMRPTLAVGDVVVTSWVRADHIRVGNIVSFDDPGQHGLFLTHRVRSIVDEGPEVRFETRGDANTISEIWTVSRQTLLKRTAWKIPLVGAMASRLGSAPVRAGLLAGIAAVGALLGIAALRARRHRGHRASMKSTAPLGDADPKKRAVPNEEIEPSRPRR